MKITFQKSTVHTSVINAISFDICKYCPHYISATGYENRALIPNLINRWHCSHFKMEEVETKNNISATSYGQTCQQKTDITLDLVVP